MIFLIKKAIEEIIKNNKKENKILVLGRYKHTIDNPKLKNYWMNSHKLRLEP